MKFEETVKEIIFKESDFNKEWTKKYEENFNQAFTLILEVFNNLDSKHLIKNNKLHIKTDDFFEIVITAMFCKAYKTYQCIIMNLWNGYCIESENLARSLFELSVNMLFICQKQKRRRARRYIDYKFIEDIVLMKGFDEHLGKIYTKQKRQDKDKRWKEYEEQFEYRKRKFIFKDKTGRLRFYPQWSKENFGTKCANVGLLNYKSILYHQYSSPEHSGPSSVLPFLKDIQEVHKFYSFLPEPKNIERIITESTKLMTLIFFIFAKIFKLALSKKFKDAYIALKNNIDFKECFEKNAILRRMYFI